MTAPTQDFDEARAEEFGGRLFGMLTDSMTVLMIDLAGRTGLFAVLAEGPGTTAELAERSGLLERYLRECLAGLATASIVDYDAASGTFSLPAEHAACLTGGGPTDMTPMARITSLAAQHVTGVATAFREGGGVPYEAFRPEFTEVMDGLSRGLMDAQLISGILPADPELPGRLAAGLRVADVGCGTGHAVNLMAAAFPASTFTGFDFSDGAIEAARKEAADLGLANATFEVRDAAALPRAAFDVVFAFDSIHDQKDPAGVLRAIHDALSPGGRFVMMDIKANSALEDNVDNPFAPLLYGVSTLHCMTVSLALGGAGLGAVWGEQTARRMLGEAGFTVEDVLDVPEDPMDSIYLARRS